MAQFLSQQFNSILGSWSSQQSQNTSNNAQGKKFRAKILDLYDDIFMKHKKITQCECNFLHLKVHRNGLYQCVRNALKRDYDTITLFNKTFQFCINSLLDEKLLIVQHAFQVCIKHYICLHLMMWIFHDVCV